MAVLEEKIQQGSRRRGQFSSSRFPCRKMPKPWQVQQCRKLSENFPAANFGQATAFSSFLIQASLGDKRAVFVKGWFWRMYPHSGFRSGGTCTRTPVPVFVPGEHPNVPLFRFSLRGKICQNHPFGKPPFCQPQKEGGKIDKMLLKWSWISRREVGAKTTPHSGVVGRFATVIRRLHLRVQPGDSRQMRESEALRGS